MTKGTGGRLLGPEPSPSAPAGPDRPTDGELLDRFATDRDGEAFTALVRRHGPVVLAACRRVLRDRHDAEEVFQTAFLVLVRKAGTLRRPELLSNWLYGVATRLALKARSVRRFAPEEMPTDVPAGEPEETNHDELRAILDEEMVGLPDKYRVPLVLCYLEGLTNEDAARKLGWPTGSISYRLARGRDLLRQRLRRRGVFVALPWLVAALAGTAPAAPVPDTLVRATGGAVPIPPPQPVAVQVGPSRGRWSATVLALLMLLLLTGGAVAWAGGVGSASRSLTGRRTPAAVENTPPPSGPDFGDPGPGGGGGCTKCCQDR